MQTPPIGQADQPYAATRHHWMSWVARHATMQPGAVAFRYLGADTTWRSLHERSTALAAALARRGVAAGDRVVTLTLNRTEFFETVLAVNALGAIAVPVNFRLTPVEVGWIVQNCGARVIVTEAALLALTRAVAAGGGIDLVVGMDTATEGDVVGYEELVGEPVGDWRMGDLAEDTTALILYTSGTTGHPKGAMLTHGNMGVQALTCIRAFWSTPDDISLMAAPRLPRRRDRCGCPEPAARAAHRHPPAA